MSRRAICHTTQLVNTIASMRSYRKSYLNQTFGFVPTMGALHEGHLDLVKRAKLENDKVIASIFVNPKQFLPGEDFSKYPRQLDHDLEKLQHANVDLVFAPDANSMFSPLFDTYVSVDFAEKSAEGRIRPLHFRGVATVCTKLFNIVQPENVYFGEKDGMQCIMIQRMVRDLNIPVNVNICQTVREADGLAKSSRNAFLSQSERKAAPMIYQALSAARQVYHQGGDCTPRAMKRIVSDVLAREAALSIQYVSVASVITGEELPDDHPIVRVEKTWSLSKEHHQAAAAMLSVGVKIGSMRLIDNVLLK